MNRSTFVPPNQKNNKYYTFILLNFLSNKLYFKLLLVLTLVFTTGLLQAQYTLALNAAYTTGFNSKNLRVTNTTISQNWHQGYQFNLVNGYHIKESPFEITSRIGMKYLKSEGDFQHLGFTTETYKVLLGLGALYHFESGLKLGAVFTLENNLDFDNFISQTSDLFRYSFQSEVYYPLFGNLDAMFHYSIALSPLKDHYLVTNPQHQFSLGLKFNIL